MLTGRHGFSLRIGVWFMGSILQNAIQTFVMVCGLLTGSVLAAGEDRVLVLGDSLSAAYGLPIEQGWVHLLQQRLEQRKPTVRVVNASISGETTAGGRARIQTLLQQHRPSVVVLALGANDGLRGLPLTLAKQNLAHIIQVTKQHDAKVLLVGMQLPPNYGPGYATAFAALFVDLAKQQRVEFLPFLLEPIAMDRNLFQTDNLHPTAGAQPALRDHVAKKLLPMLDIVQR
jgi:acyl-CoA thioesterase I